MKKRLTALVLSLALLAGVLPIPVRAAECQHHTHDSSCSYAEYQAAVPCGHVHDESCGYRAAVEGHDCGHIHDESCGYVEAQAEVPCTCPEVDGVVVHEEGCGYKPAVEGHECQHIHDESCGYAAPQDEVPCGHAHNDACGYKPEILASPCTYVCSACAEDDSTPPADNRLPDPNASIPDAALAVIAMIDALPHQEDVDRMVQEGSKELDTIKTAVQAAYNALCALDGTEAVYVTNTMKLQLIMSLFAEPIMQTSMEYDKNDIVLFASGEQPANINAAGTMGYEFVSESETNNYRPTTIDVRGKWTYKNGRSSWLDTTYYADYGAADSRKYSRGYNVESANLNGANIAANATFINNGMHVKLSYTVTAVGEVTDGKLAVHSDIRIGTTDDAIINVITRNGRDIGFTMTEKGQDPNAQFTMYFAGTNGTTDITTYWYGPFAQRVNHLYDGNSRGTTDDSGIAISWQNIKLAPGESKTFSFIVGIGAVADPPEWGGDNQKPIDLSVNSTNLEDKTITVKATVEDTVGQKEYLFYKVNGGPDANEPIELKHEATGDLPATVNTVPDSGKLDFTEKIDLTSYAPGTYDFDFWLQNGAGMLSEIVTLRVVIDDTTITIQDPHEWEYSVVTAHTPSDSLKAECINAGCHCSYKGENALTLTLSASDASYDGDSHGATLTGSTAWTAAGLDEPEITYKDSTGTALTGAPTTAGTYTASISAGDQTASVEYKITKGAYTITDLSITGWPAGQRPNDPACTVLRNGQAFPADVTPPEVTYTYYSDEKCETPLSGVPTKAGTYYVKASVLEDEYCTGYTTQAASFTITLREMTVTAITYSDTYDGQFHSSTVSVTAPADATNPTITYITTDASGKETTHTTAPAFKDAGTYTVGYQVECENFTTVTGEMSVTIAPKEVGITWSPTAGTTGDLSYVYTGAEQKPVAAPTDILEGDTCGTTVTVTDGETTVNPINVGTYKATASLSNSNYTIISGESTSFEIIKATPASAPDVAPVNETILNKGDGQILGITTEMEYSTDSGKSYIRITEADLTSGKFSKLAPGTYYVRYAETDNWNASTAKEVTIAAGKPVQFVFSTGTGYTLSAESASGSTTQASYGEKVTITISINDGFGLDWLKVNGTQVLPAAKARAATNDSYTIETLLDGYITVDNSQYYLNVEAAVKDIVAPTGSISIKEKTWDKLLETLSFGLYISKKDIVTIDSNDLGLGVDQVYYHISTNQNPMSESEVKAITNWTAYTEPFTIDKSEGKYVVYAKITDKAGHTTVISSDGLIMDLTGPEYFGIEDGGIYCLSTSFTVSDPSGIASVKLGDQLLTPDADGKYTVPANGLQTLTLTDTLGNVTTVSLSVNKEHVYSTVWDSDCTDHWHSCIHCGHVTEKDKHHFGDSYVVRPATKTKAGVKCYQCYICGYVHKVRIPPLDEAAKTGDSFPIHLWLGLALTTAAGLAVLFLIPKKKAYRGRYSK